MEPAGDNPGNRQIAAVVLAAGLSTRMGRNKLLVDIHGQPLVRRVIRTIEASRARPVIVVTGHDREAVGAALAGTEAAIVHNAAYRDGLSTSLRTGISGVEHCDAAIILLADMPAVSSSLIDRMLAAYDPANGRAICVATRHGRRGNPVLFDRKYFPDLMAISGDIGARNVIARHAQLVCEVEADDDAPMIDLDTPDDVQRFRERP